MYTKEGLRRRSYDLKIISGLLVSTQNLSRLETILFRYTGEQERRCKCILWSFLPYSIGHLRSKMSVVRTSLVLTAQTFSGCFNEYESLSLGANRCWLTQCFCCRITLVVCCMMELSGDKPFDKKEGKKEGIKKILAFRRRAVSNSGDTIDSINNPDIIGSAQTLHQFVLFVLLSYKYRSMCRWEQNFTLQYITYIICVLNNENSSNLQVKELPSYIVRT